ncbi:MAG: alpha/beta fold hydrolase [Candidatus Binatia bacterium]
MPIVRSGEVNIHYQLCGEGEPLLLIMGFGMTGDMWLPSLPYFSGFRTAWFDNRGVGRSDQPDSDYSIDDMVADAVAVLDDAGMERAHLFGVSMGGMIAQALAIAHPERVNRLVLGCTSSGVASSHMPDPEVPLALLEAHALLDSDLDAGVKLLIPLLFPDDFVAANGSLHEVVKMAVGMNTTPAATISKIMGGIMGFDVRDRLGGIAAPTLVIHGDEDRLIPIGAGREIAGAVPGAVMHELSGAGHAFMVQKPDSHLTIADFLAA